ATAADERAVDPGDDAVGPVHPVKRGVTEYGVELSVKRKCLPVENACVQAEPLRALDLRRAGVDGDDAAPAPDEVDGERPVAAAEVEHPFARAWRLQIDATLSPAGH